MLETLEVDADDVDSELWFQQDVTTAHSTWIDGQFDSHAPRTQHFEFCWHHLARQVSWTLWRSFITKVYANRFRTLGELKEHIRDENHRHCLLPTIVFNSPPRVPECIACEEKTYETSHSTRYTQTQTHTHTHTHTHVCMYVGYTYIQYNSTYPD